MEYLATVTVPELQIVQEFSRAGRLVIVGETKEIANSIGIVIRGSEDVVKELWARIEKLERNTQLLARLANGSADA